MEGGRGCRKFRTSTFLSVYSVAMLVIVLFGELLMMIGQGVREDMDNVYAFAYTMKSSGYMISHSGFLFCTFCFVRKV
jgi:hypothetical protein